MKKNLISNAFEKINPNSKQFISKNLDITEQVYALLEQKKWTQKDLADQLGKHESDISRMLSGMQNLTLKTITKLEVILGEDIILTPTKAKQQFVEVEYSNPLANRIFIGEMTASSDLKKIPEYQYFISNRL